MKRPLRLFLLTSLLLALLMGLDLLTPTSTPNVLARKCRDDQECSHDDDQFDPPEPRPLPTRQIDPPPPLPPFPPELRGFADIHNHQFANLAFGGRHIVGKAFGPIDQALSPFSDLAIHGFNHKDDIMGAFEAARGPARWDYPNSGYPDFVFWPSFKEVSHQKVYQDWLYHAVQGGLRLMVMFAEDSPALCKSVNNDGRNCDDEMSTINRQLDAVVEMQEYVDQQSGGPRKGWYRIVKTPAEAREVIRQGKLAVVLGIETAHLFNCRSENCAWLDQFQYYWKEKGVRHFFPIHQGNNGFGGASYFLEWIQYREETGVSNNLDVLFKYGIAPYHLYTRPCPQYAFAEGRCNMQGLTNTGRALIEELMRAGVMIDVDHMSDQSSTETLDLAQKYGYPVVASHAGFNEINNNGQDHEGQLTRGELQRIHDLGGMVGIITGQGDLHEVDTWRRSWGKHTINHVCGTTSETFAQAYYYAIDSAPGMPIAIGTDFNAPLVQPGPRFGPSACHGGRDWDQPKWEQRLGYPFQARGSQTELDRLTSGNRTFDFNEQGLANVGLLPDFFADLEALGMSPEELEPLFRSAEGYLQVWEKAIAASRQLTRRMYGRVSPGILQADRRVDFTISAVDAYLGEPVTADVYLNDEYVGKTDQVISRSFGSVCVKKCGYVLDAHGVECEFSEKVPTVVVKLVAPNYFGSTFELRFEVEDDPECGF